MKKIFFIVTVILSSSLIGNAQEKNNPIITAVPSLTIAPDARAGGMGDIGAASSPDVNSQYWNPAKYVFMESNAGFSLSYTPWLRQLVTDIDLAYLAGYYKFSDNSAVSMSMRYFSLGDITLMDQLGEPQGSTHPNELAVDGAFSQKLSENLSASVALRFIYSDLNNGMNLSGGTEMYPGISVAGDVSSYYRLPITLSTGTGNLSFGLNISNIGAKISYDENVTSNFIPTNLRLGTSFDYPLDEYQTLTVSADINKLLVPTPDGVTDFNDMTMLSGVFRSFSDAPGGTSEEMQEIMWSLGAEYAYNKQFFVRAGYFNENQYKGNRKYFTAGAGFKLNIFQLDAGYVISTSQSNPLDQTLRFSLSFDLFGLKNLMK
ncbi:MAG TPA: type IX secretion system outer membrane channel protein PorV [Paludibacter sp.]|nr:type IX secretion system outer membrane channel protein PorV [Paludibacter sp.]